MNGIYPALSSGLGMARLCADDGRMKLPSERYRIELCYSVCPGGGGWVEIERHAVKEIVEVGDGMASTWHACDFDSVFVCYV